MGVPSIFDPMFPAMYYSFFGSYPPWLQEGVEKESGETGDEAVPVSPVRSNVSIIDCTYILCCAFICTCVCYIQQCNMHLPFKGFTFVNAVATVCIL